LATSALLAALLGALMFRDRTRLPIESVDGYLAALDAAGAPTALAAAENPCSHRDDLPTCRFVVGTGVCVGVEPTVIDTSGWVWDHLVFDSQVARMCQRIHRVFVRKFEWA